MIRIFTLFAVLVALGPLAISGGSNPYHMQSFMNAFGSPLKITGWVIYALWMAYPIIDYIRAARISAGKY